MDTRAETGSSISDNGNAKASHCSHLIRVAISHFANGVIPLVIVHNNSRLAQHSYSPLVYSLGTAGDGAS